MNEILIIEVDQPTSRSAVIDGENASRMGVGDEEKLVEPRMSCLTKKRLQLMINVKKAALKVDISIV